jgi:hypothetical protein
MSAADVYCPNCGYNLRAILQRRCPECGFGYDHAGIRDVSDNIGCDTLAAVRRATFAAIYADLNLEAAFGRQVGVTAWPPGSPCRSRRSSSCCAGRKVWLRKQVFCADSYAVRK